MSLLVIARDDLQLPRICQVVGHFMAHRRRREDSHTGHLPPLLGIWRDADPFATVSALSIPDAPGGGWVAESFGNEGQWYVCWLTTDLGDQGEIEVLGELVDLLRETAEAGNRHQTESFTPCFPAQWSPETMQELTGRLAERFPDAISRGVKQAADSDRLLPV